MPDNLALSGQFAGQLGIFAPLIPAAGVLVYFNYASSYAKLNVSSPHADHKDQNGRIKPKLWLAYYPLVIRVLAAILLATGLTVSSGFVFNEVFVYWFPNFAFAFILLAGLLGLQFLKSAYRDKAQIIFVATVLLGLTVLIIVGLTTGFLQERVQATEEQPMGMSALFLPLLFLLGFDMAIFPVSNSLSLSPATVNSVKSAIAVFAGLMIFWIITALLHVDGQRLSGTSIAHLITAREIGGQAGRMIMGGIIIAGTCAAVNALFASVTKSIEYLGEQRMLPRMNLLPKLTLSGMVAVSAFLMAKGLAGEELLETLIRAVLLLWLGKYGLITIYLLFQSFHTRSLEKGTSSIRNRIQLLVTATITFSGILGLALTDDQPMLIFTIMVLSICAVLVFGGIHRLSLSRSG